MYLFIYFYLALVLFHLTGTWLLQLSWFHILIQASNVAVVYDQHDTCDLELTLAKTLWKAQVNRILNGVPKPTVQRIQKHLKEVSAVALVYIFFFFGIHWKTKMSPFFISIVHFSAFMKCLANINNFERTEMSECMIGTGYGHITWRSLYVENFKCE